MSWIRDGLMLERFEEPDTLVTVRLVVRRSNDGVSHTEHHHDRQENAAHDEEREERET